MLMAATSITRQQFLEDRQGRTFADVLNDAEQPFDQALAFFSEADRQRRMEESELHHNRPPLAGVVRELESLTEIDRFLATMHPRRTKRLRQAVGVVVRIIMERRGWKKTGKKGSLGVRAAGNDIRPSRELITTPVAWRFGSASRAIRARRWHALPLRALARAKNTSRLRHEHPEPVRGIKNRPGRESFAKLKAIPR